MDKQRLDQFLDTLPFVFKMALKPFLSKIKDEDFEGVDIDLRILRNNIIVKDINAIYYLIDRYNISNFIPEIYEIVDGLKRETKNENE